MKKLFMGVVSVALLYLTSCTKIELGSDNKCKNCNIVNNYDSTRIKNDTTPNGNVTGTPITLLNIKIGSSLVLYGDQENSHETGTIQSRPKKYVNYINPMTFSWQTSQRVKVMVDVRITDFATNQTLISKLTPQQAYDEYGTYQFPDHIPRGLYIISAAITLIDPNNSASNKTYNYIHPLCVQ